MRFDYRENGEKIRCKRKIESLQTSEFVAVSNIMQRLYQNLNLSSDNSKNHPPPLLVWKREEETWKWNGLIVAAPKFRTLFMIQRFLFIFRIFIFVETLWLLFFHRPIWFYGKLCNRFVADVFYTSTRRIVSSRKEGSPSHENWWIIHFFGTKSGREGNAPLQNSSLRSKYEGIKSHLKK